MSKDHVIQTLPQALQNDSASSIDSPESISNLTDRQQSRDPSLGAAKRWKQWVDAEVRPLQAAICELEMTATTLSDVMSRAQRVLNAVPTQCNILSNYVTILHRLHLSDISMEDIMTDDDGTVQVNIDALQQRLRDVLGQQRPAAFVVDVMTVITQLMDLLTCLGK
jgi:hypothetical protein